jgi:hypothetical protein
MPLSTIDTSSISGLGYGFKNRIINGAMMIDQRSNGGSTSIQVTTSYATCDRWAVGASQNSKFTVQSSTTAPSGFVNSLLATSSSAYSITSTDNFQLEQRIEGLNCSDLAWGTASASAVALSFWVRSSLTGTFGGSLRNSAGDRSYPFSYTINAANTWEQKTINITGDVSGTWLTTNGVGIRVGFSLGSGSTLSGTASSWAGANYLSATGATSVVGTSGATFYITGVQLEKGSTATSFDYRPYSTELALCQRYCQTGFFDVRVWSSQAGASWAMPYPIQQMRAQPTGTFTAAASFSSNISGTPTMELQSSSFMRMAFTAASATDTYYGRPFKLEAEL